MSALNVEVFFTLADARRKLAGGGMTTTITVLTLRLPIGRRASSPPPAAEEKTAIQPLWKTLRVSHFPSARLRPYVGPQTEGRLF